MMGVLATRTAATAVVVVGLLVIAGVGVGLAVLPVDGATDGIENPASYGSEHGESNVTGHTDSYVVEQDGECHELVPLSTSQTVVELYDYRSHETHPDHENRSSSEVQYSSHGTVHLQENDTSIVFLHEGSDGLSLVVVHDELAGGTDGGSATFEVVGLPPEGEWVVKDDNYTGAEDDTWVHGDVWTEVTWVWRGDRTDGGAFNGGLDESFELTIHPAFNEEAAYRETNGSHDGEISAWQALSGDADDPDRIALALDEPLVIRSGTCDGPNVRYDRTETGISATVSAGADGEPAQLRPPSGSDATPVTYDRVAFTPNAADAEVEFGADTINFPTPSNAAGIEPLSSFTIETIEGTADDDSTVRFRVDRDYLDANDVDPDDVAVYVRDDGGWSVTPTGPVDEFDDHVAFEADVPVPATTVVATQHPVIELLDVTIDQSTIDQGESIEVAATVENMGRADGTYDVELMVFGDVVASERVTVGPDERATVTFTQRIDAAGTHVVDVNGHASEVTVESTEASIPQPDPVSAADGLSNATVGHVVGGGLLLAFVIVVRRWL